MEVQVRGRLTQFIVNNFLFGDQSRVPADDASLLESGILDSTGILELIEFLETDLGIEVDDSETLPKNLDTIANLTAFVLSQSAT